jgi:hypothetical protein
MKATKPDPEYTICEADAAEKLCELVRQKLKDGWELHGYLIVGVRDQGLLLFAQALTK